MSRITSLIHYPAETPDFLLKRYHEENNNILFFVRRDVDSRHLVLVYVQPATKTIMQRKIQAGSHEKTFVLTSLTLLQVIPANLNAPLYDESWSNNVLANHQAVIDKATIDESIKQLTDAVKIQQTSRWKERRNAIAGGLFITLKSPTSPTSPLCADDREGGVFSPSDFMPILPK